MDFQREGAEVEMEGSWTTGSMADGNGSTNWTDEIRLIVSWWATNWSWWTSKDKGTSKEPIKIEELGADGSALEVWSAIRGVVSMRGIGTEIGE